MTNPKQPDAYGTLSDARTLTIQRLLPGPIDRVWSYLTESDLRRKWLASGVMEMKVGAPFVFVWRNNELTNPPGQKPEGSSDQHQMESRIIELDPPHLIAFSWGERGAVSIQLAETGDKVLLTLTHRGLPDDRAIRLKIGAGWHAHLDLMVARITGDEPAPFWDTWSRLRIDYDRRMPA